jgi:hypothetical protein
MLSSATRRTLRRSWTQLSFVHRYIFLLVFTRCYGCLRIALSTAIMRFYSRRPDSTTTAASDTVKPDHDLSKSQIKRATRTRKTWALITSFFLFITVIFLILLEIGGTKNESIIRNWYFIKLDLSNIVPSSVPNSGLINTIAQTLGLHDFYQVGLWGYCEGYNGQGITDCSDPQTLYWFNPVQILRDQLLAGASSMWTKIATSKSNIH